MKEEYSSSSLRGCTWLTSHDIQFGTLDRTFSCPLYVFVKFKNPSEGVYLHSYLVFPFRTVGRMLSHLHDSSAIYHLAAKTFPKR
jgi:hypothetical protein